MVCIKRHFIAFIGLPFVQGKDTITEDAGAQNTTYYILLLALAGCVALILAVQTTCFYKLNKRISSSSASGSLSRSQSLTSIASAITMSTSDGNQHED